jgi:endoglucanase
MPMKSLFLLPALFTVFLAMGSSGSSEERPGTSAFGREDVALGVYDPHSSFARSSDMQLDHIFIYWQALDLPTFRASLRDAGRRGRAMMVTVEPYTRAINWRDGGERLFSDILGGSFSREIATICQELGAFEGQVLVRWGHEMEKPTGRYPWARDDNRGYRAAYRHFVDDCRRHAPDALFVWSPIGESNLEVYYPGDSHVDLVGVSLWGLQSYDQKFFAGKRDFPRTFADKYERAAAFGKPVIIAELGVSGDREYRELWFQSLFESVLASTKFEALRAVVLFNDKEPHYWPMGLGSPDWRVDPAYLIGMKQAAQQLLTAAR